MELGDDRLPLRFWDKIEVADGCWRWTGCVHHTGYAHFSWQGATVVGHVLAYSVLVGPVADGLELDHACHDPTLCSGGKTCLHRRCVNPVHLEPVTPGENSSRGTNANHGGLCRNGLHSWDGSRAECLECERARKRRSGNQRVRCSICGEQGLRKHKARHVRIHSRE